LRRQRKSSSQLAGTILWIDGKRAGYASFTPTLRKKGLVIDIVSTGKAALERLGESKPDMVVVDGASMRTSGLRICQTVREANAKIPILLISNPENPVTFDRAVNVVISQPFTIRKLVNRIEGLFPLESNHSVAAGPVWLDMERNIVRCDGKEAKLTPRLAKLLKMLMDQPGTVIEREKLFQEVWSTEYIGDTRTLDVHISWLRSAFEENPRKPKYLRTIRGVGYRLDV